MIRDGIRLLAMLAMVSAPGLCRAAPYDTHDFAWSMARGAQVPMQSVLRDEAGRDITLAAAAAGRPVILDIGYYKCALLCGVVRADLLAALEASGLAGGHDYALLSVSIDPAETPRDAAAAKLADLARAPSASAADWHYLTGPARGVAAVTSVVGFHARYDADLKQFLHPTGLVLLTKAGIVSGYLLGVGYSGGDLRAAVLRAGKGGIAQAALPILLLCFHFDSTTGRYTLAIEKVLRLMGIVTVLTLGGFLLALHRHRPHAP